MFEDDSLKNPDIISLLIQKGATFEIPTRIVKTPLVLALIHASNEIAAYMIDQFTIAISDPAFLSTHVYIILTNRASPFYILHKMQKAGANVKVL